MLKKLSLKNFTAFSETNLEFCKGLNVIVGENGSGKTHLLKLGYLLSTILEKNHSTFSKAGIERHISERLLNIFKPDKIGNLTRSNVDGTTEVVGLVVTDRELFESGGKTKFTFRFSDRTEKKIIIDKHQKISPEEIMIARSHEGDSVYLPSKEMISFFDGFLSLYEKYELPFDETFKDLGLRLSSPKLKESPQLLNDLITQLSRAILGKVILKGGRFYIVFNTGKNDQEITLLAEGLRKLATLIQLIENGSLQSGGTLFWDEPDANMNPRLIRLVAEALIHFSNYRIQVIITTHSLFLLRELDILLHAKKQSLESQFFGLHITDNGTSVVQGRTVDDIGNIASLDESLMQSDRYLEMDE